MIYFLADTHEEIQPGTHLTVETHWNRNDLVVLTVPGAKPITVLAADLELAIKRCSR